MSDSTPPQPTTSRRRRMPILVRHAISLAAVFALAIPISYLVGTRIHRGMQLDKLDAADAEVFNEGLAYVGDRAAQDPVVLANALERIPSLPVDRAAQLLLVLAVEKPEGEPVPDGVYDGLGPLMARMSVPEAVGLFDAFVKLIGADTERAGDLLLKNLKAESEAGLMLAVQLLDSRLLWSAEQAPRDLWVRWLMLLAGSESELTQVKAARLLGRLPDDVDDPRLAEAMGLLSGSEHDGVRAEVLGVCAGYAAIAKDPTDYEQLIFELGQDKNKVIARRAWLIVGHLNPLSGFAVNWKEADPFVAEAMLWAAVKTNPENPEPAIRAVLEDDLVSEGLLALGETPRVSLLGLQHERQAGDLVGQSNLDPDFKAARRCMLAVGPESGFSDYWLAQLRVYQKYRPSPLWSDQGSEAYAKAYFSLYCTMSYRLGEFSPPEGYELMGNEAGIAQLAAIEGYLLAEPASPHPIKTPDFPIASLIGAAGGAFPIETERVAAQLDISQPWASDLMTIAMSASKGASYEHSIRSGIAPLKRCAVLAAGMTKQRPSLLTGVTAAFLRENPDLTREQLEGMSDAELGRLGLSRVDALTALLEAAESAPASAGRQDEVKLLKLALWMRGDLGDDFTPTAEAMLFDKSLPTSTVLMCLLHMKRPIALEYLFGERFRHPANYLQDLFIAQRWWHVFRRFVDTSGLTLWLWGDPEAQAFQVEAMRQWYAVNRWEIERGRWPDPVPGIESDEPAAQDSAAE